MAESANQEIASAIEEVLSLHKIQVEAYERQMAEGGDFSGVLYQTELRLKELQDNADTMLAKMGMDREELNAYMDNRANFSPEEWAMLEKTKQTCEEIRQQSQKIIESQVPQELLKERAAATITKVRKKKKRHTQKKNWLQI